MQNIDGAANYTNVIITVLSSTHIAEMLCQLFNL